jgi:hypothetical protein
VTPATSSAPSGRGDGSVPSTRGPSLFTRFMRAKYGGGSGCPDRMNCTNPASSDAALIDALCRSS